MIILFWIYAIVWMLLITLITFEVCNLLLTTNLPTHEILGKFTRGILRVSIWPILLVIHIPDIIDYLRNIDQTTPHD